MDNAFLMIALLFGQFSMDLEAKKPAPPVVKPEAKKPGPSSRESPQKSIEKRKNAEKSGGTFLEGNPPVPPPDLSVDSPRKSVDRKSVYIRFYTAKDCGVPCHSFLKWRETFGNTVGCEMEHFQFDSVTKASEQFPSGVPRFELYKPGGKMEVRTGWSTTGAHEPGQLCPDCLRAWVAQAKGVPEVRFNNQGELRVAAAVQSLNLKSLAGSMLPTAKRMLGTGSVRVLWHHPKLTIPLWNGGPADLSPVSILGADGGRIDYVATGTNLPKAKYGADLGVDSDGPWMRPDRVHFSELERFVPQAPGAPQTVGFGPLTILSGLMTVLKVFSFHCDLNIAADVEGAVSMSGDVLVVDVTRGATVSMDHFWKSESKLTRIEIAASGATVFTSGSRLIPKKRTIAF